MFLMSSVFVCVSVCVRVHPFHHLIPERKRIISYAYTPDDVSKKGQKDGKRKKKNYE